ncbi:CUB domain-containing protein 2-like [Myxocyprinus asiaticus]|uniref:CUB domain-containing protein 2-like n=1 Tax=Myxocyprinus asiaticus TaxID=70543 RepID=UPI0022225C33|nr:CUB domain-containing protein 2-like [Myxocyprinus asiaticus]
MKLRSDGSVTYRGFKAHRNGCGGTLTTSAGGFTSPNYPLPYHPNAECYWHIKTSAGRSVELSFGDFHLETTFNCFYDYLVVRQCCLRQPGQFIDLLHSDLWY